MKKNIHSNRIKPNVLFIIDDQHRYDWVGCAGADWVKTPHIDALAARGMYMKSCFTNSPVCAPARTSLATGLLPTRFGATSNDDAYLPISAPNMYKHFRDNGYRVSLVGRHDLAKNGAPASIYGNRPLNFSYGFTESFEVEGGMAMSWHPDNPNGPYGQYLLQKGLLKEYCEDFKERSTRGWILNASHDSVLPAEHYQDVFVANKAIERILNIEDDYPWFMFVSFQGPHDPFDPPSDYADLYRNAEMPKRLESDLTGKPRRFEIRRNPGTEEQVLQARRQYAAKITLLDDQVGKMLAALKKRSFTDDTIVVYCSDHGEMLGDHGLWIKHCAYEPAWHVPCVIVGPGIPVGTTDALVELSDLNPTLAELAGMPPQPRLDAKSFAPVLRGEAMEHRTGVVCIERSPNPYHGSYRALRTRTHKYIMTDNDVTELYDLEMDPDEYNNLADEQPEIVKELRNALMERFTEDRWMR